MTYAPQQLHASSSNSQKRVTPAVVNLGLHVLQAVGAGQHHDNPGGYPPCCRAHPSVLLTRSCNALYGASCCMKSTHYGRQKRIHSHQGEALMPVTPPPYHCTVADLTCILLLSCSSIETVYVLLTTSVQRSVIACLFVTVSNASLRTSCRCEFVDVLLIRVKGSSTCAGRQR